MESVTQGGSTPSDSFSLKLVYVDDSPEDRAAMRRMLSRIPGLAFEMREADTGLRGLRLIRESMPDCLLLDYYLGDMDGAQFLQELGDMRDSGVPLCPVVILTAVGTEATAVSAMKAGAQDYLLKGQVTPEGLLLTVESAMEKVRLRRQLHATETRLRSSLDNMPDPFGIYSAVRAPDTGAIEDFRVEYVNDAACYNNRLTREEQVGQLLTRMLPGHSESGLIRSYAQVVETGEPLRLTSYSYADTQYGGKGAVWERAFDIHAWKLNDGFAASWRDVTDRVETERSLRTSEERLRLATDGTGIGTWYWDIVNERHGCSPLTLRLLGMDDTDPADMNSPARIGSAIHPDDLESVEAARARTRATGEDFVVEYRAAIPHADGTERWLLGQGRLYRDADGLPARMEGILQDISPRKQAEAAILRSRAELAESESRYRLLAENMSDMVGRHALDGKFEYVSPAVRSLLGFEPEDLLGRTAYEFFHPDDVPAINQSHQTVLAQPENYTVEYRMRRRDGSFTWLETTSRTGSDPDTREPTAIYTSSRDISSRKKIEAQLVEHARTLEFHVENTPLANVVWTPEGKVQSWSRRAEEMFGWRSEEIEGDNHTAFRFVHDDDTAAVNGAIRRLLSNEESTNKAFSRNRHRDGRTVYCEWYNSAARDAAGRVTSILSLVHDVTEREAARSILAERLRREQGIAASLQRSLLTPPPEGMFEGLRFHTIYRPASREAEVGGDFYDVFALRDNKVALVVADISGKGLEAAQHIARVKFSLRAYLRESPSVENALNVLNVELYDSFQESGDSAWFNGFVCLSLAIFDPRTCHVEVAAAGAEPALLLRGGPGGAAVMQLSAPPCTPLGVDMDSVYTTAHHAMEKDDVLFQYTDGLSEARNGADFLDSEGVEDLLRRAAVLGEIDRIGEAVADGAKAFANGAQRDDVCILLSRCVSPRPATPV